MLLVMAVNWREVFKNRKLNEFFQEGNSVKISDFITEKK